MAFSMRTTAVAFLDALGFKGIWRESDPEKVLSGLAAIEEVAGNVRARVGENLQKAKVEGVPLSEYAQFDQWSISISDTLIIGASADVTDALRKKMGAATVPFITGMTVDLVAEVSSAIVGCAVLLDAPFIYRGAISVGECERRGQFVVGPAIDEAAELERFAEGAMIIFAPSALDLDRVLQQGKPEPPDGLLIRNYDVPGKEGRTLKTHVLNALSYWPPELVRARMLSRFDSRRLDVYLKRQNTAALLERAVPAAKDDKRQILGKLMLEKLGRSPEPPTGAGTGEP